MKFQSKGLMVITAVAVLMSVAGPSQAGLVRHWDFDGSFTDNVANDTGTPVNGATFGANDTGTPNTALMVDHTSSQYVRYDDGSALDNLQTGSIYMLVKWDGLQDQGHGGSFGAVLGRQWNSVASNQVIALDDADPAGAKVTWRPYVAGAPAITGNTIVGDGQWRHIVITYSSGDHKLYVDGQLDGSSTTTGTVRNAGTSMPMTIGAWIGDGNSYSTSKIDQVRIYDHVLTEQEVRDLIPEPASIALLALGGVAFVRRTRRGA